MHLIVKPILEDPEGLEDCEYLATVGYEIHSCFYNTKDAQKHCRKLNSKHSDTYEVIEEDNLLDFMQSEILLKKNINL